MTAWRERPAGFALVIVLWSVVLLALLAAGVTGAGRSQVQLAGNIRRAAAVQAAADGGVFAAVFHAADAPGRAWPPDGLPRQVPFGAYRLTLTLADENRKMNPNFSAPALMAALMGTCGADPAMAASLAEAVAEWRTPGAREAVAARYRRAGRDAAPTGAAFASVAELGLVLGMTPPLVACLAPHLSVYTAGPLNVAQADEAVRRAVRMTGGAETATPLTNVLDVTSEASGRDGSLFVRHAIVALTRDGSAVPYRVLAWEARPRE